MKVKTLVRLSPGPLSRPARLSGVPPDDAEAVARGCARVDPEWVTLSVRCLFQEPPFQEASGAELLFDCRNGPNGTLQHRTVAVDFVHGRVDFDFLLDAEVPAASGSVALRARH
jgi:hypothetical protein